MLVIKEIKVEEIDEKKVLIPHYSDPLNRVIEDGQYCEFSKRSVTVVEEIVRGRNFINNRGQKVCIGLSKQAQEAIGLPFECFENLHKENSRLQEKVFEYTTIVSDFLSMNLWGRIKFLFKGVFPYEIF